MEGYLTLIKEQREEYDKLKEQLQLKNIKIEEMRKELINNDEYIDKLQKEYDKEIERLNNIINELEKDIIEKINNIKNNYSQVNGNYFNMNYVLDTYEEVLDKLQELKGDKSNETNKQEKKTYI